MTNKPVGLLAVTLLTGCWAMAAPLSGQAGPFEDGKAAYDREDYAAAAQSWRGAATQGDAKAQLNLGALYSLGLGVPQDDAAAAQWYRQAADQGLAKAQFNLGFLYERGRGVPQDPALAALWFRKAADQGHANAQYHLGVLYHQGQGVAPDAIPAWMWLSLAVSRFPAGGENHRKAVELLNKVAAQMTSAQLEEAKRRAQEWKPTP